MLSDEKLADLFTEIHRQLTEGRAPWLRGWSAGGPRSLATGRPYRGLNALILDAVAMTYDTDAPNVWATFRQVKARGGHVRKGEHGTRVVFWKVKERAATGADDAATSADDDSTTDDAAITGQRARRSALMRLFTVFHVSQCEGLTLPPRFTRPRDSITVGEAVLSVIAGYENGPTLTHRDSDSASYSVMTDVVAMPLVAQFDSEAAYAETLFHEFAHSTGHVSRLNRFDRTGTPDTPGEAYAREELVAEIGAALIARHAGISCDVKRNAAYLLGWASVIKNDPRCLLRAAGEAQRAADRVTGSTEQADDGDDDIDADTEDVPA